MPSKGETKAQQQRLRRAAAKAAKVSQPLHAATQQPLPAPQSGSAQM
jgi:hypothetical protein